MKTLANHTIIYDDECPLCNAYTSAFLKTGILDASGRVAYSEVNHNPPMVDWDRARNEIALVNKVDNSVLYGIDSLLRIIGYNIPWVHKLFQIRPLRLMLDQLYFFISYNRKVIAPGRRFEGSNLCIPDMNYAYRCAYILFAGIVTSIILNNYLLLINHFNKPNYTTLTLVCFGQAILQGAMVLFVNKKRALHYVGNMMTVLLAGSLLLLPVMALKNILHAPEAFTGYLILIICLSLFEHIRRAKLLELPALISVTWMFYIFVWIL